MDENTDQYRWQSGYEKTWEAIKETDDGFLDVAFAQALENAKKKQMQKRTETMKLGMMRHVFLVLDFSEAMSSQDLKPTRLVCMLKVLECFLIEFFDQNPISQLGLVIMRNKRAEKLLDLSGSMQKHRKLLGTLSDVNLVGEPSIQNALELCHKSLKLLPTHTSKEIVLIIGSLTTCDPSEIDETIKRLKTESIQCSIIGLAAEVNVCHRICKETGGSYNVILDDSHFLNLLMSFVEPPSAASSMKSSLVKMGFPHNMDLDSKQDTLGICMCHLDNKDECRISTGGHYCPQCFSKYCELPVECKSCGLTLVSAPHLARSYHHLFPIKNYTELFFVDCKWNKCYACQKKLSEYKYVYECSLCKQVFCRDCNEFIHEILHVCPGCSTTRSVAGR